MLTRNPKKKKEKKRKEKKEKKIKIKSALIGQRKRRHK
jgi:hypothetical protein